MKHLLTPVLLSSALLLSACGEGDNTLPAGDLTITDANAEKTATASVSVTAIAAWHSLIALDGFSIGPKRSAPASFAGSSSKLTIAAASTEDCDTSGTMTIDSNGDSYTVAYDQCTDGSEVLDGTVTSSEGDGTYAITFADFSYTDTENGGIAKFDGSVEVVWDSSAYTISFNNFTSYIFFNDWKLPEAFATTVTTYSGSYTYRYENNEEGSDYYTFTIDNLRVATEQTEGQAITISTPATLKFDAGSGHLLAKSTATVAYEEPSLYPETGLIRVEGKRGTFLELDADTGVETTAFLSVNDSPTYQVTYDDLGIDFEYLFVSM